MSVQHLTCDTCQQTWSRPAVRGRKPQTCPACKSARSVPAVETASAVPAMSTAVALPMAEARCCGGECACGA